jgi:hypothetical protein
MTVKWNATVMLTVPSGGSGLTNDQWKAACRQVAEKQMPKVLDAALG